MTFGLVEARFTLRLSIDEDGLIFESLVSDMGGRFYRVRVNEVTYERDLLSGDEHLDARGIPTTGHRPGAALAAGTAARIPDEQRAAWIVEARRIAANLPPAAGTTPGGTTP